jgi:hypothetical protein
VRLRKAGTEREVTSMAKVEMKMPEEFLQKVSRLGEKTDEIVARVLKAGGKVVLDRVKRTFLL